MSPPLPPQQSFESVFSLQGPVEPDHKNHITSSFSVLDINDISGNLDIYSTRSKRPSRKNIAQSSDAYKGNMSCFSLAGIGTSSDLGHIALSPTSQANYVLAEASVTILSDSGVLNQLDNSSNSSITAEKPPSSIYSHSLLQPIHVRITHVPDNWWSRQQENRPLGCPSRQDWA
ncbi:hypothetical protein BYT27DRAFT_7259108 [Phlegmacium glaucopus]|nr:hypothetical protein BYT27DRAFT_7259108 [Phlegmacium glaucopus]